MNNGKKVLIVEDDADVAKSLAIRFAREFEVAHAVDGLSAVHRARSWQPDVIVLDLGLPAGDGFAVLQALRDNVELAHIPVLVVTGRDGEAEARAMALGAVGFFQKPADPDELLDAVRQQANRIRVKRDRVLVVDDDGDVRSALTARLRAHDYDVVCAEDGATALMMANRYAPDVIVLDLGLPAGDGFTVLDRVRRIDQLASTPVIVLSGRDAAGNRSRALTAGAAMFLEKPATEHELLQAIGAVL